MFTGTEDHQDKIEVVATSEDAGSKTRAVWATEITGIYREGIVTTALDTGKVLLAAKDDLRKRSSHGEWLAMIESDLPFSASVAQRYMKIAKRFANTATMQLLPADYSSLYELAKLSDAEIGQAMANGQINPETTRKQAAALGKSSGKIKSPNPKSEKSGDGDDPAFAIMVLGEIDKKIGELNPMGAAG